MWALREAEEKPTGRGLAEQMRDGSSLQRYVPKDAMNLGLR